MSIFKWRDGWAHEYGDVFGKMHRYLFPTKTKAQEDRESRIRSGEISHGRRRPAAFRDPTLGEYQREWLSIREREIAPATYRSYEAAFRLYLCPHLGHIRLKDLDTGTVRRFFAEKVPPGLSANTVRIVRAPLHAMLEDAIHEGIIQANPAIAPRGKRRPRRSHEEPKVKAFDWSERARFFAACPSTAPSRQTLLRLICATGLRIGEAFALRRSDLDAHAKVVIVSRQWTGKEYQPPKGGKPRTVKIQDDQVLDMLRFHERTLKEAALKAGAPLPELLFPSRTWTPLGASAVDKSFKAILAGAGLSSHYTPHCLRHTYARLMLERGESLEYICQQMGHSSIKVTYDNYGHWARLEARTNNPLADRSLGEKNS